GAGGYAAQLGPQRVAGVLDDLQVVAVGDDADGVPVRGVAGEVREQQRPGPVGHHLLDLGDVHVVRVRLDVDEDGYEPGPHDRGDVGGERQRGGDHLTAGRQLEQLDGEVERRGTGVAHDAER